MAKNCARTATDPHLSIIGHATGSRGMCDRISRRRALHIGALGAFGLSLTDLLRAENTGLVHSGAQSRKSVILVWMHGGPSQLDTFDMKPDAPTDIRGEFRPIATQTTGLQICEHLPKLAQISHLWSLCRSLTHASRYATTVWLPVRNALMQTSDAAAGKASMCWDSKDCIKRIKTGAPSIPISSSAPLA
jgi:hypothetical protein